MLGRCQPRVACSDTADHLALLLTTSYGAPASDRADATDFGPLPLPGCSGLGPCPLPGQSCFGPWPFPGLSCFGPSPPRGHPGGQGSFPQVGGSGSGAITTVTCTASESGSGSDAAAGDACPRTAWAISV